MRENTAGWLTDKPAEQSDFQNQHDVFELNG